MLRLLVVVAWIAAAVAAWTQLPALGGAGSSPLSDIVPPNAQALRAQAEATRRFGAPAATDLAVVVRNAKGLTRDERSSIAEVAAGVRPPLRGALPLISDTTVIVFLVAPGTENLEERRDEAQQVKRAIATAPGTRVGVTGAAPARLAQFTEIERVLPTIEVATIAVILLVVALYFRSLGAPLVTLTTAAVAYVIAVRLLAWLGERAGVDVPREIEPLLVVLLLGLVTDYSVFFLAEARRRLLSGETTSQATSGALRRMGPTVLTAGLIVSACSAALLAGRLDFFRVFGPGLALCALVVTGVAVTLVPALIALFGPRLFGRRVREAESPAVPGSTVIRAPLPAPEGDRGERWSRRLAGPRGALRAARRTAREEGRSTATMFIARVLATRPAALLALLACIAGLGWAASQARQVQLGVSFTRSLPADAEPRVAADDAARGFTPGVLAPTDVVVTAPGIGRDQAKLRRLQRLIAQQPGVDTVLGPAQQAAALAIARTAPRLLATEDGGAVRFVVVLDTDPTSAGAIDDLRALRDALPSLLRDAGLPARARTTYGGETALADETVAAVKTDLRRIAIAVALVTLLLLVVFLRALVAPVALLAASALGYLAALGLTSLIAERWLGGTQLTYYVPLVGAVLLVALGSDYNVLIAGRIRGEAQRRRMREAIAVAAPQASRAITVAGLTLAATFALLGVIPLRAFRELGLLLCVGVLVDALVVRPVLIPSALALLGDASWWPGRARRPTEAEPLLHRIAERRHTTPEDAYRRAYATLQVLGERIGDRQARELAAHLPERLRGALTAPDGCEPFDAIAFVDRVAQRTGTTAPAAQADAMVVLDEVAATMPATEWDYVRAALTSDYDVLLDPVAPAPAPGRFTTGVGSDHGASRPHGPNRPLDRR